MTWTDATANSKQWGELALSNEVQALDERGNGLTDETGSALIVGVTPAWSDVAANAETWT